MIHPNTARDLDQHKVARITFHHTGFLGSQQAALSYSSTMNLGYIWLVDTTNGRDCKGEWNMDGEKGSWWMLCKDGTKATGEISPPQSGIGTGHGLSDEGSPINFTFSPAR